MTRLTAVATLCDTFNVGKLKDWHFVLSGSLIIWSFTFFQLKHSSFWGDIKSQKACWEEKARKLQACCCTFMRGREELFLLSTLHHPFHQLLCFIYTTWWALLLHCRDIIAWAVVCGRSPVWFQSWKTSFGSRHLCYVSEQCQVAKSLRMKAGKMIVMELNNLCWSRCAVLPITESDHSARSGALTLHVFYSVK